jgi:hypothetical protein
MPDAIAAAIEEHRRTVRVVHARRLWKRRLARGHRTRSDEYHWPAVLTRRILWASCRGDMPRSSKCAFLRGSHHAIGGLNFSNFIRS